MLQLSSLVTFVSFYILDVSGSFSALVGRCLISLSGTRGFSISYSEINISVNISELFHQKILLARASAE